MLAAGLQLHDIAELMRLHPQYLKRTLFRAGEGMSLRSTSSRVASRRPLSAKGKQ
jgi:hypothetical protein